MVSDQEGIKTRTPSFIHHNLFYEKSQTSQRGERETEQLLFRWDGATDVLSKWQITGFYLVPHQTKSNVKTQTEHNYNALLQSIGVY